jgi:hypothetical protein
MIRRLYRFGRCNHVNCLKSLTFAGGEGPELAFCTRCGRLLWMLEWGNQDYNPHIMRDYLEPPITVVVNRTFEEHWDRAIRVLAEDADNV